MKAAICGKEKIKKFRTKTFIHRGNKIVNNRIIP